MRKLGGSTATLDEELDTSWSSVAASNDHAFSSSRRALHRGFGGPLQKARTEWSRRDGIWVIQFTNIHSCELSSSGFLIM